MKYLLMIFILVLPAVSLFAQDKEEIEDADIPVYPDYRMVPDDYVLLEENEKSPFLALTLSIIFPGAGQIYTGNMIHGAVHTAGTMICIVPTIAVITGEAGEEVAPFAFAYFGNMVLAAIFAPIQAKTVNDKIKKKRAWLKSKGIDLGLYHKEGASGLQFSYRF